MTENDALLILNAIPGIGNRRCTRLIERCGSARAVLALSLSDMQHLANLPENSAKAFQEIEQEKFLEEEYRLIERHQVRAISIWDGEYPERLRNIPDAPLVLYLRGQLFADDDIALAIVGTRRPSIYGQTTAQRFATALAEKGVTIISGLARGIDTAAHRGALRGRGRTIAVLGCGLSQIYPLENIPLAKEIERQGALLSEFPMSAPPSSFHFPRRNRIISGLTLGVVVVEAAKRSGALITSDFALEQGREVFAVPGQVDQANAQGTNHLIKQGAKLVITVDDILEEIALPARTIMTQERKTAARPMQAKAQASSDTEEQILNVLNQDPISIASLAERLRISLNKIFGALLQLEIKKLIKQVPGQCVVRTACGVERA
jgi:DNA processing protein